MRPEDDAPLLPNWPLVAELDLPSPNATEALAARLAPRLGQGDTLLLSGQLGSGKSHFARALIRALFNQPDLAVPSPTFTLVQTYGGDEGPELWHADLYRLGDPGELVELGLDDAFQDGICLIEWPDRLAPHWPDAVLLNFLVTGEERRTAQIYAPNGALALLQGIIP